MAQMQRAEVETEVKCSADKFFDTFTNNSSQFTKINPQVFKSIQVLEGDGKSVNSVRLWKYVIPAMGPNVMVVKEKIKALDTKNRTITMSMIEGDIFKLYKRLDAKVTVTPKDDGCCVVKWCLEFEKNNKDVPNPDAYLQVAIAFTKELGRYLLKK